MFIIKVPGINGLGKTKGCEKAGNEILESLKDIHSNEQGIPIDFRLFDLEEIHLDNSNIEEANSLIYKNSFKLFETNLKTIFLGGDHSVSYSLGRAFFDYVRNQRFLSTQKSQERAKRFLSCQNANKQPCLIIFDAHADCMPAMQEPTHEEWLRGLIEKGFPIENILLVGVRNMWRDEIQFVKEKGIKIISMNQLLEDLQDTCDTIMEFASHKELYVSIDIDVLDPSVAPGTGYIEPGGLTTRQFIYLIQRINKIKSLRAVDIVEINPEKDVNGLTTKLGAKILAELL